MNKDCDFQIGHDHAFLGCQDYCLVGEVNGETYAILADGCSASPDVDIGARILALAAKEIIIASHNPEMKSDLSTYESFGKACVTKARSIYSNFPNFHPLGLDATLLVLRVKDQNLRAYIYGDGAILYKSGNQFMGYKVELTTGAPDYLSYTIDPIRLEEYRKFNSARGGIKKLTCVSTAVNNQIEEISIDYNPFDPIDLKRPVQTGDIVAISSDGIGSFRKADNTPIDWIEIGNEFIGYKNTTGVFVKRRINAFKKKCAKEGTTHADDISVASIII